jgi:hypothetical protein
MMPTDALRFSIPLLALVLAGCGDRTVQANFDQGVQIEAGEVIGRITVVDADAATARTKAEQSLRDEVARVRSVEIKAETLSVVAEDRLGDTQVFSETFRSISRQRTQQRLKRLPIVVSVASADGGKSTATAACRISETQLFPELLLVQALKLPPDRRRDELPSLAERLQAEDEPVLAEAAWRHAVATPGADAGLWFRAAKFFQAHGDVVKAARWAEGALAQPGSAEAHVETQALLDRLQTTTPAARALVADLRALAVQRIDKAVLTAGPATVTGDHVRLPRAVAGGPRRLYALWWDGEDLSHVQFPDEQADGDGQITLTLHRDSTGGELLLWALPNAGGGWVALERTTRATWPIGPTTDLRSRLEICALVEALGSFATEAVACSVTVRR